jgi:hypothetical protein
MASICGYPRICQGHLRGRAPRHRAPRAGESRVTPSRGGRRGDRLLSEGATFTTGQTLYVYVYGGLSVGVVPI